MGLFGSILALSSINGAQSPGAVVVVVVVVVVMVVVTVVVVVTAAVVFAVVSVVDIVVLSAADAAAMTASWVCLALAAGALILVQAPPRTNRAASTAHFSIRCL